MSSGSASCQFKRAVGCIVVQNNLVMLCNVYLIITFHILVYYSVCKILYALVANSGYNSFYTSIICFWFTYMHYH